MHEHSRMYGAILAIVKNIISSVTNIVYVPVLLYFIGTNEFGIYQLIGALMGYIISADFGQCSTIRLYTIARLHHNAQAQKSIIGLSLTYYSLLTAIVCSIGYVFYFHISDIFSSTLTAQEIACVENMYILLLINIAITFTGSVWTAAITSHERFIFLRLLQIGQSILRPITICSFVFFFPYAYTIAIIQTAYNIFYTIIRAWYCYKKLHIRISFLHFNTLPVKEFVTLASTTLLVFCMEQFLWRSNQIIVGVSRGVSDVAEYAVASVIILAYVPFATAVPSVFFPKITSMITDACTPKQLSDVFTEIGRIQWILLLLILLGFTFVGQEFITLWAGPEFHNAYYIALLIMIPFSIELMQSIGISIMQAQNTFTFRLYVYIAMGIANLLLAIPLSSIYGTLGCATATATVMIIGNGIIMNYYFYKHMRINILHFWKEMSYILFISTPVIPVAIYLNNLYTTPSFITFFIKIICITVIFLLCQTVFALATWAKRYHKNT